MANGKTKLYIPVAGTGSRDIHNGEWYRTESALHAEFTKLGYTRFEQDGDPGKPDAGYWSGALNGTILGKAAWKAGAKALEQVILSRQADLKEATSVTFIAHSHGGQVVAMALERLFDSGRRDILFNFSVVTVDMPVRSRKPFGDMKDTYANALVAVAGRWTHLYAKWSLRRLKASSFDCSDRVSGLENYAVHATLGSTADTPAS